MKRQRWQRQLQVWQNSKGGTQSAIKHTATFPISTRLCFEVLQNCNWKIQHESPAHYILSRTVSGLCRFSLWLSGISPTQTMVQVQSENILRFDFYGCLAFFVIYGGSFLLSRGSAERFVFVLIMAHLTYYFGRWWLQIVVKRRVLEETWDALQFEVDKANIIAEKPKRQ